VNSFANTDYRVVATPGNWKRCCNESIAAVKTFFALNTFSQQSRFRNWVVFATESFSQ